MQQSETSESESDDVSKENATNGPTTGGRGGIGAGPRPFQHFRARGVRGVDDGSDGRRRVNKTQTPSFSAQRQPSPLDFSSTITLITSSLRAQRPRRLTPNHPPGPPPNQQSPTTPNASSSPPLIPLLPPPLLLLCSSCPAPSTERTDCLLSSPISHLGSWTTSLSSRHLSPPEVVAAVPNRNSRTASARHHPFPAQRISSFAHPQDLTLPRPGYPPPLC